MNGRGGQTDVKTNDGPQDFAVLGHAVADGPQILVVLFALGHHHIAQHLRFQQLGQAILQTAALGVRCKMTFFDQDVKALFLGKGVAQIGQATGHALNELGPHHFKCGQPRAQTFARVLQGVQYLIETVAPAHGALLVQGLGLQAQHHLGDDTQGAL